MAVAPLVSRDAPLFRLRGVTKTFPNGTVALRGVDVDIYPGEVHGLLGANGAGKSTLIKILSGALERDGGTIELHDVRIDWRTPKEAKGVATVYQHTPLVPTLTVLENVFLGREGRALVDRGRQRQELESLFERLGWRTDPDTLVSDLPLGQHKMIAVLQALARDAELVILDEPTAALAEEARALVLETARRLAQTGIAVIYISHLLDEIVAITDRVTVLRDGRVTLQARTSEIDHDALVQAIAGERLLAVESAAAHATRVAPKVALSVEGLRSPSGIENIDFVVHEGEVLGLAGLLGSGRSETLHAIFGADRAASGLVRVDGQVVGRSPSAAVRAGLALVPEDRARQSLVGGWEIWKNMTLPDLPRLSRWRFFPSPALEQARARRAFHDMAIRAPSANAPVSALSGGNAQKVVFAKWAYGDAKVFLLDEPTVGVDVGTKADILALVQSLAREGRAAVFVSSEFEELLAACDRILVLRRGRIVAERLAAETDEHELIRLAGGLG
ncbi:MAG TPA: sugar ABC transporter ATP-binding protein [Gaiellaceae bacterium]|nr:sugar ABC transporter ATP-binding protein [Gaiellaceae bacterium]